MEQKIPKYFDKTRKNIWKDAFKDNCYLLRGSICRKQEKQLKQKAACWRRKREERTEDGGGGDWGPLSFWELCSFYYIPSVSCYSSLPVPAGRSLTRKKSGDREAREGIPGHKRFTSPQPQPVFQARTIHVGEEKIWNEIGRPGGGGGVRGGAWMTYNRELYTLRNKAGNFKRNRISSPSWEAPFWLLVWPSGQGSTWNSFMFYLEHTLTGGSCQNLIINRGLQQEHTYKLSAHLEQTQSLQISFEFKGSV